MSTLTCAHVIRISRGEGAPIGASNYEFLYYVLLISSQDVSALTDTVI